MYLLKKRKKTSRKKKSSGKNDSKDMVIQYVLPVGNGWVVKNSTLSRFTILTDNKREAIYYARAIAKRRGERLEIHERNGKITKERYRKPKNKNIFK